MPAAARVDSREVSSPVFLAMIGLGLLVLILALVAAVTAGPRPRQANPGASRMSVDDRDALDAEDLDELLAVTNAWRRSHGLTERTRDDASREFGATWG